MTRVLVALLPLLLVLLPSAVAAQETTLTIPVGDRINRFMQNYMQTARQPGVAVVVVHGNDVILNAGYGWADREAGRPMTADTPMIIGSTTKSMTALAIMQLVEQGLVDLDAPVVQYLPDFRMDDPRYVDITLRQLLSNSSGLQYNNGIDSGDVSIERHVAGLASSKLKRDPGTGYEYANDGFILAGLVVQRVFGMPYERYMQEHVFAPLGMSHTTFDFAPGLPTGLEIGIAQGYGHHRGYPVRLDPLAAPAINPAGGAITTADDAGRYLRALLGGGSLDGGRVLSPESVAEMWRPSFHTGDTTGVGLGWEVQDVHGEKAVSWIGGAGTFGSIFMAMPERGLAVGVINNYDDGMAMEPLAGDILTIALGDEPQTRPAPVESSKIAIAVPDRSNWDRFVGTYASERDVLRVTRDGDRLVATVTGGDVLTMSKTFGPNEGRTVDLVPTSPTDFVFLGDASVIDGMPVSFRIEPDGTVSLLLYGQPFGARKDG